MNITSIDIFGIEGFAHCKSCFYTTQSVLSGLPLGSDYHFNTGINKLTGDIDSGIWAVSYFLSMYGCRPKDFIFFEDPKVMVNKTVMPMRELSRYTCYIDELYPLFSTKASVRKLVVKGLKKSGIDQTVDSIKELFQLDDGRFERRVSQNGNERYRAMAAIGCAYDKKVFCLPWMSQERFEYLRGTMGILLKALDSLGKIVILPVGK